MRTEKSYINWIRRFIIFHDMRQPQEMSGPEIRVYMDYPKRPKRLPVVLTREEVKRLLNELKGVHWLMAGLLYGSGLRFSECLRM